MNKTYYNSQYGIGLLLDDVKKECEKEKKARVRITLEFFDDFCRSCNKQIELGKESEYAGRTSCHECRRDNEEFDNEMS